jgi:hypothetical protein
MENDASYFVLLLTLAFVASMLSSLYARKRRKPLIVRPIRGYAVMPSKSDEAIESDRRLHISLGAAAVGQSSTIVALAALTLVREMARRQAFTKQMPLVTVTDSVTLAAVQDALQRTYRSFNNLEAFDARTVIWYPRGERSLAFGAGVAELNAREPISTNIMVGVFGAELAYVADVSARRDRLFIGHSTLLEGQAIAYAFSEASLIGEELFVGDAYLDPESSFAAGRLLTLDILRWFVIGVIILVALLN